MGIIRQGILGGFRNKTGSVVGAYWRNRDVIRGLPRVSNKPATQAQINQRFKFGLVTGFLARLSSFIDLGFGSGNGSVSAMNEAVSYHLREAITGAAPNFSIDYSKLKINKGKLLLANGIEVAITVAARIDFSWLNTVPDGKYKDATDRANVVVYNPAKNSFVTLPGAAARSALGYNLLLPADYSGDEVHCYISFSSVIHKKLVSDTFYVGEFIVL
ncbi:DUF6266 family protein [Pedobacter heparinus]|uniref:Uncharacterized protein n=1 Tax=Pedobacter heparinus (strain ATCC 13125 / DSM 2366 / CIP 104194 / JCM 7457 / NBRC 12017 / NCIMB 9290 / NRRL B-14731 / HIM 762-3) TaxID=485917 RepID=C6Y2T3_PEDHD|nr:DUF6266 family protein [Pedobacter heparinus]ACU03146.1 hypothetical protein Phep_0924 [Pedobacter heparinus DSM 2366]